MTELDDGHGSLLLRWRQWQITLIQQRQIRCPRPRKRRICHQRPWVRWVSVVATTTMVASSHGDGSDGPTLGGVDPSLPASGAADLGDGDDDDERQRLLFGAGDGEVAKLGESVGKRPATMWRSLEAEFEVAPDPHGPRGSNEPS